ncbi:hypothetical protein ACEZCY_13225 [Streptacidiphilus sp. N1-12]|uniref:Uncharacterized protein n=2 Tax=Streptacidiphilus alkalitolerans TaxID=3342712 RepID=A0ABV6WDS9_9ACTN
MENNHMHTEHQALCSSSGDSEDRERSDWAAITKRAQGLKFWALIITLSAVVLLVALGQPWVAGIVTTTAVPIILPIFAIGGCRHTPAAGVGQTPQPAVQEPPGSLSLTEGTRG